MTGGRPRRPRVVMAWSTGKDAAFALHELRQAGDVDVVGLLTSVAEHEGRVAMHGVPDALLERQVEATGLPCHHVLLPWPCPNEVYLERMRRALAAARSEGADAIAFGDLFLADIRAFREQLVAPTGLSTLYPLWGRPTGVLAGEMLAAGFEAVLACVDSTRLPAAFAGRRFDAALLEDLPADVDPCGENGEFHTFVTAGPIFSRPVEIVIGERRERDGFMYADLRSASG